METNQTKAGIGYAVLAYLIWGLLPLYWKLFASMSSWEVLAHRVLWSFVFVALVVTVMRRWGELKAMFASRKVVLVVCASSLLISCNWLIFIWAVNNDHVIESSLGYYMNPLFNVLMGVLFLKERPRFGQWLAIALAFAGVAYLTFIYGKFPWISLTLALTFGLYGLTKKKLPLDSMLGLVGETVLVLPVGLLYLGYIYITGASTVGTLPLSSLMALLLAGAATAVPLWAFAQATKRMSLSTLGFLQYIGPTITLFLGVVVFKEAFSQAHMVSFALIWSALVLYTVASNRKSAAVSTPKAAA
ncbi:EamA family transporter RarD [Paenibacillus sp. GD4]|uniref:EamA family transporter RarD n=1 Tax=Paenibacillus sp. GD4 TaxID=3068890 RepID=UPI00279690DC|nr:EamA family transporter RarD [Paenibacillus sp. GD4]MDQ1908927.1 EamA family transporter RarD [Paenibacillus sp. GD4]